MTSLDPFRGLDVATMLGTWATTRHRREALVSVAGHERRRWTYDELHDEAVRLAGVLQHRFDVEAGDRVAVATGNAPEFLLGMFGIQLAGGVAVAIHASSTAAELDELMRSTRCVGMLVGEQMRPQADELLLGDEPADGRWALGYRTALPARGDAWRVERFDAQQAGITARTDVTIDRYDPALILFTSGSTGHPKAVVWTHANVLWAARTGAQHAGLRDDDRFLVHLPLAHVVALSYSTLATLWAGGTVIVEQRFSVRRFWPTALAEHATWTHAIDFVVKALREVPVPDDHNFRRWIFGRANSQWDAVYGIPMMGLWGMTEMVSQPIYFDGVTPVAADSLGRQASEYELRIVDADGCDVASGEPGLLLVRGARGLSVAAGYDAAEHATTGWRPDGWFDTGDVVEHRPCGSLVYVSRGKDVVSVGGETVYCKEIERAVELTDGVNQAAAVGVADELRGEVPVVFVVADQSGTPPQALVSRIDRDCEQRLSAYKRPARVVVMTGDLPRLATGKPDKAELRRRAAAARPDTSSVG